MFAGPLVTMALVTVLLVTVPLVALPLVTIRMCDCSRICSTVCRTVNLKLYIYISKPGEISGLNVALLGPLCSAQFRPNKNVVYVYFLAPPFWE